MDATVIFTGILSLISATGTAVVLVIQASSAAKMNELRSMAETAKVTADKTHELAQSTEINTNSRYTEQRVEIEALKAELKRKNDQQETDLKMLTDKLAALQVLHDALKPPHQPPQ